MIVTTYPNPDLDGVACTVGYSEYLNKTGLSATPRVFGEPDPEAVYVLEQAGIDFSDLAADTAVEQETILVDSSNPEWLPDSVDPENIVEIIDHREDHYAHEFPNATAQIELVGAAATLIVEKFYENNVDISEAAALLLYAAIVDNTLNFNAGVTTALDKEMAKWLQQHGDIPESFVGEIFNVKSDTDKPVAELLRSDFAATTYGDTGIGIAQLEIRNLDTFIRGNTAAVQESLTRIKEEEALDLVFLSGADIQEGYNMFVAADSAIERVLEEVLDITFSAGKAKREQVLLRKKIWPRLKRYVEQ